MSDIANPSTGNDYLLLTVCHLEDNSIFLLHSTSNYTVKNLPAVQETQVRCLGQEDPLEKGMDTHSLFFLGNPMDRGSWQAIVHGVAKIRTGLND